MVCLLFFPSFVVYVLFYFSSFPLILLSVYSSSFPPLLSSPLKKKKCYRLCFPAILQVWSPVCSRCCCRRFPTSTATLFSPKSAFFFSSSSCTVMAAYCNIVSHVYLFVVLHFLFLLVVLEQHVMALALLVAFLGTLSFPAMQEQPGLVVQPPSYEEAPRTETDAPEQRGGWGSREPSFTSVEDHRGAKELTITASNAAVVRRHHNAVQRERGHRSDCAMAVGLHHGTARADKLSCTPPHYSLACEAEEEIVVVPTAMGVGERGSGCRSYALVESSSTAPRAARVTTAGTDGSTDDSSLGHLKESVSSALPPSAPHGGWVWATAVVSLFSVCASVILWLVISRCSSRGSGATDCAAPPWTYRTPQRTLLSLFAGIQVERHGVRQADFFFTVVTFAVLGSLSIGHALCAALLRCRRSALPLAGCHLEQFACTVGAWLVNGFTFAPFSLLWVFIGGVGQGTAFGCLYVLLALLMVLSYPRCVLSWRRRCWLLYLIFLLLLWTLQACLRLAWIRESLETYTAETPLDQHRRRLFILWGLLPATATTASADMRWRVVLAVGVWWAGVECFCFHTAVYVTCTAVPRMACIREAAKYRSLYKHALVCKEKIQLARALALQRAAHRKVEELRSERETAIIAATANATTAAAAAREMAEGRTAHDALGYNTAINDDTQANAAGATNSRQHAPFGSCESLHCSMDRSRSAMRATRVLQGNSCNLSPVLGRSLDRQSSAPMSHVNSNQSSSSCCESDNSCSPHAPLIPRVAASEARRTKRRASWRNLTNNPTTWAQDCDNFIEYESSPTCPSIKAESLRTTRGDVTTHELQDRSDFDAVRFNASRLWAREPTRSPARAEDDGDDNENRLVHLLNASPRSTASSSFSGDVKLHRATTSTASVPPSCSIAASAAPAQRLQVYCASSNRLPSDARRCPAAAPTHNAHGVAHGVSPFHSMSSTRLIVGCNSPVEDGFSDLGWTTPPAVDTTATMFAVATREASTRAAQPCKADRDDDKAAASASTSLVRGAEKDEENPSTGITHARGFMYRAFRYIQKELRAYLTAHTLPVEEVNRTRRKEVNADVAIQNESGPVCRKDGNVTGVVETSQAPASVNSSALPFEGHQASLSITRLLVCYVLQHWVWVCALLSLLHFTVASTAINLAPSLASLVYALLLRPWPPRWHARAGAVYAAGSVLGKCLLRALIISGVVSDVSSMAARSVDALLLCVRLQSSSSPSSVTLSVSSWVSWFDLVMGVAALCAAMLQWTLVYADECALGGGRVDADHNLNEQQQPSPPAPLAAGCSPQASMAETAAAANNPQHIGRLSRWNRHRRGAGADYYTIQLSFDVVSLMLFCWAYYAIAPGDTALSQDNLLYAVQHNRLPGIFVATALGLVVLLIVERILYVLHALLAKYVLHFCLALVYHALYLAWRVVRHADNANSHGGGGATRASAMPVALLMAAKLASLWCGTLQLRHGYPLHRTHDPFTIKTDVFHWFGHMAFRAVPFLLELRVLLDWSFSATTLKVQHWMLLEDIHHNVYRRYVDMHDLHWTSRHQGRRFPYYVRLYQGMLSLAAILLVLFFPLFWYSTFGPQVHASAVTAWTSEVAFRSFSVLPFFTADASLTQTAFHTAATTPVGDTTPSPADLLRFASAKDTWQFVQPSQCSSQVWAYTPTAMTQLITELRLHNLRRQPSQRAQLVVRSLVTRSRATETSYTTCSIEESYTLTPSAATTLVRVLEAWQAADRTNCSRGSSAALTPTAVPLPSFYTPYVVSSGSSVVPMAGSGVAKVDCTLTLHRMGPYRGFTCLECAPSMISSAALLSSSFSAASSTEDSLHRERSLVYVVASTDVTTMENTLSLIPNVGVVALYTSFVLVMSTYIRNFFAGDAHRVVLLQLANPEPVAELLRYLYLTRSSACNGEAGDLFLEQLLFLELLDLLRSPERLLALGGRRVDDYARREYRADLYAVTKRPFDLRRR